MYLPFMPLLVFMDDEDLLSIQLHWKSVLTAVLHVVLHVSGRAPLRAAGCGAGGGRHPGSAFLQTRRECARRRAAARVRRGFRWSNRCRRGRVAAAGHGQLGIRYGSMEAEEQALGGQLEQGAANGGAAPPREGEQVVAARTDVSMGASSWRRI